MPDRSRPGQSAAACEPRARRASDCQTGWAANTFRIHGDIIGISQAGRRAGAEVAFSAPADAADGGSPRGCSAVVRLAGGGVRPAGRSGDRAQHRRAWELPRGRSQPHRDFRCHRGHPPRDGGPRRCRVPDLPHRWGLRGVRRDGGAPARHRLARRAARGPRDPGDPRGLPRLRGGWCNRESPGRDHPARSGPHAPDEAARLLADGGGRSERRLRVRGVGVQSHQPVPGADRAGGGGRSAALGQRVPAGLPGRRPWSLDLVDDALRGASTRVGSADGGRVGRGGRRTGSARWVGGT